MTPHPSPPAPAPSPAPGPIGRDAGGVPLIDLLRAGLIRMGAPVAEGAGRPAAA